MMDGPSGKLLFRGRVNRGVRKQNIMGDRSPKANQKKTGQKQSKANVSAARKKAATASKQAAGKKK
jgi:hypothetical protein